MLLSGENMYRKRIGSDTWHWFKNCTNWPAYNYDEQYSKPLFGGLCNECKSKDASGACNK